MANKAEQKAAKLAALKAEEEVLKRNASAHTVRLSAIATEKAAVESDEDDEDDEEETNPDGSKKKPDGEDDSEDEASKIAASAEAKSHPHLAMAAIASKQSLTQLQATVKAAGAAPKGHLAAAMENAPRLGPDGEVAKAANDLNPNAIYAARAAKRT